MIYDILGKFRKSGDVAVKKLNPDALDIKKEFAQEVTILRSVQHENIVQLYGYYTEKNGQYCIVTEVQPNGSLLNYLQEENKKREIFPIMKKMHFSYQVIYFSLFYTV